MIIRTKIKYFDNEMYLYQKHYKSDYPNQLDRYKYNLLEFLEYKEYFNDNTLETEYYFKLDDLIEFSRQYYNK